MSIAWLLRRLLTVLYTLLVVSIVVFGLTQLLPADAAVTLLGENATPEALAAVRLRLGLNDPAWLQYWHWLSGLLRGDFGTSMRTDQPVGPTMFIALSRSLLLGGLSIMVMLVIAIPLGMLAALQGGRRRLRPRSYLGVCCRNSSPRPVADRRRDHFSSAGDRLRRASRTWPTAYAI